MFWGDWVQTTMTDNKGAIFGLELWSGQKLESVFTNMKNPLTG
jgi:hypothetical protein